MKIHFFSNKKSLLRQSIVGWAVLTIGVFLFTVLSLLLSAFITSRETIVIVSFLLITPILVSVYIALYRREYRLHTPEVVQAQPHKEDKTKVQLQALLILVNTLVLLALVLASNSSLVAIVAPIVLAVLIMVVSGAVRHLPATLRALAQFLRRK